MNRCRDIEFALLAAVALVSACEETADPTDAGVDGGIRTDADVGPSTDSGPSDAAPPDAAAPPGDVAASGTWTTHCGDLILGTECSNPSLCGCTTTTVVATSGVCGAALGEASQTGFIFRAVDAELQLTHFGLEGDRPVADPDRCAVLSRLFSFPSLEAESIGPATPDRDQCSCVAVRRVGAEIVFTLDCTAAVFRGSAIYDAQLTGEVTLERCDRLP